MSVTKSISFRENTMRNLNEFIEHLNSFDSALYKDWNLSDLHKNEIILYQGINAYPHVATFKAPARRYSMESMFDAQILLDSLNFLEEIKYMNNVVSARAALRQYLYYGFNLTQGTPSIKSVSSYNFLAPNTPLLFGKNILPYIDDKNQPSKSATIRKHLDEYINALFKTSEFELSKCTYNAKNKKVYERSCFYLPFKQVSKFLLAFTYYDGRDFSGIVDPTADTHLPRLKKERQNSESSYKLVLNQTKKLLPEKDLILPKDICNIYDFDNLFSYCQLNTLNYYYNLYTSDMFFDRIIRVFSLSYRDAIKLENDITQLIFYDKDFMTNGFNSPYADFMLPFDICFQYVVFGIGSNPVSYSKSLLEVIENCKSTATKFWKKPLPTRNISSYFVYTKSGDLDIRSTESRIIKELEKNNFFKNHYSFPNSFIDSYLKNEGSLVQPTSFEIINTYINSKLYPEDSSES